MTDATLERGRALVDAVNPGMEDALDARYGHLLPDMAQSVVDFAYGQQYSRLGLGLKSR